MNDLSHIKHTAAGTILTIFGVGFEDMAKTMILAIIGATVSFFVSVGWKYVKEKYFKK